MDSTQLLTLFRTEVQDTAQPYLWADEDVLGYIDDAQKMFCREAEGIADATTTAVVDLAVTPGADWLTLHPSILQIRTATRGDNGRPVVVTDQETMPAMGWRFDGLTGQLKGLITGMEEAKVRVYPVATETVTVKLTVFRLPLFDITDTDQVLEVNAMHHRHLLLWVKHLAYSKHDAETFDKDKAEDFEQRFLNYCAQAKRDAQRRRFKARTVAYGGI